MRLRKNHKICKKNARISESDHVCDIEDEGKHDDGDKSVRVYDKSDLAQHTRQFAPQTID